MLLRARIFACSVLSIFVLSTSLSTVPDSIHEQITSRRKGFCVRCEQSSTQFLKKFEADNSRLRDVVEVGKGDPDNLRLRGGAEVGKGDPDNLRLRGGAEVGKGDPRWIVKEREDGKNVGAWHWEERDMLPFARFEI
jgi:hypothetical protein